MIDVMTSLLTGFATSALAWVFLDPPMRLERRVVPYLARTRAFELWRARAGRRSDPRTVLGLVVFAVAEKTGDVMDGLSREALGLRLRQARLYQDSNDPPATYRLRQLASVCTACLGSAGLALVVGMSTGQVAAVVALGVVIGGTRQRGRLDRLVDDRRRIMTIEIYTVNQLIALRVRTGGGIISAISDLVGRGRGEVVEELREALRLHRAGLPAATAFRRIADETPEPACARTYGFLALAEERGSDLAGALLSLAEDVREARREALRRAATKRRAAMLVPTIAVLAPVMLLFVGAPLPSLVFGFT